MKRGGAHQNKLSLTMASRTLPPKYNQPLHHLPRPQVMTPCVVWFINELFNLLVIDLLMLINCDHVMLPVNNLIGRGLSWTAWVTRWSCSMSSYKERGVYMWVINFLNAA